MIDLEIIAVTYCQGHLLNCFCESLEAQTNENWKLHLCHDGPWQGNESEQPWWTDSRIRTKFSSTRYQDWGHSLRAMLIPDLGDSKYTLITNGDNYYMPTFIEKMTAGDSDVVHCDFVHSHQEYRKYFETSLAISHIDCGAIIVRTDLVKRVGWNFRNFSADWEFIRQIMELNPTVSKCEKTLFVHN